MSQPIFYSNYTQHSSSSYGHRYSGSSHYRHRHGYSHSSSGSSGEGAGLLLLITIGLMAGGYIIAKLLERVAQKKKNNPI